MKTLLKILSAAGLLLTLLPSILYFYQYMTMDMQKLLMGCGMVLWFISAPFWLNATRADDSA